MNIQNVELRKAKHAKGVASLTIKDIGLDLKNIAYRVTKEKEIFVTSPGLSFSEKVEKGEKPVSIWLPTISFHDSAVWNAVVEAVKTEISKSLEE